MNKLNMKHKNCDLWVWQFSSWINNCNDGEV